MSAFDIIERLPTVQEFNTLRMSVGWPKVNEITVKAALNASIYSVCAVADNKTVGIARVIGDGYMYFYIQDFIVQNESQGKGIGTAILKRIMEFLKQYAPEGSFIGLMSAKGIEGFYLQYGFIERPNDIYGAGMGFYKSLELG